MGDTEGEHRKSHDLVKESHVLEALTKDRGPGATLKKWNIKDFTKKGDNYACVVTSVEVTYEQGGEDHHTTYVAKLNHCVDAGMINEFSRTTFTKEIGFYNLLAPLFDAELANLGLDPLKLAKCLASQDREGKELILLNDLRRDGFKMFDRFKGMDVAHTTLVVEELARFHASSYLYLQQEKEDVLVKYPFAALDFITFTKNPEDFGNIFSSYLKTTADMAEKAGGYGRMVEWLRQNAPNALSLFDSTLKSKHPFLVMCHGDCWNNNILFKYDNEGAPVDVRLLDLQIHRLSSPATDLNYLMFTSLNGQDRTANIDAFLKDYHAAFTGVMDAAEQPMPFTVEELKEEYEAKHLFGLLMGCMVLPIVVSESSAVMDIDKMTDDNIDEFLEEYNKRTLDQMDTNPLMRPRLLAMLDEMLDKGVV